MDCEIENKNVTDQQNIEIDFSIYKAEIIVVSLLGVFRPQRVYFTDYENLNDKHIVGLSYFIDNWKIQYASQIYTTLTPGNVSFLSSTLSIFDASKKGYSVKDLPLGMLISQPTTGALKEAFYSFDIKGSNMKKSYITVNNATQTDEYPFSCFAVIVYYKDL